MCDYNHYNMDTEYEVDTEPWTEKNDKFWLLWDIFKAYIRQNISMAVRNQMLIQLSFVDC